MIVEIYETMEKFAKAAFEDAGLSMNVYSAGEAASSLELPACIVNISLEPKSNFPHMNASVRVQISFSLFVAADGESEREEAGTRAVLEKGGDALMRALFLNKPGNYIPEDPVNGIFFYEQVFLESVSEVMASNFGNIPCYKVEIQAKTNIQA